MRLKILALSAVVVAGVGGYVMGAQEKKDTRLFELRTYTAAPGKMDALLARFRNHTVKLFEKHGMTNVGYWLTAGDNPKLVYVMAYPSKEAREASWKAFMADPDWNKARTESEKDGKLLEKAPESVFMTPTDFSAIK
jgi:hypothetical protein